MSSDRVPPEYGVPPTKIVFDGVQEGSEEAADLYSQYSGQIAQFHIKARQAALLSELPQFKQQMSLADEAGTMRYMRNNGQETIFVKLDNEITVTPPPPPPEPPPPPPSPRWLVVDLIIDPRVFYAWDVFVIDVEHPELNKHLEAHWWDLGVACGVLLNPEGDEPEWASNCILASQESTGDFPAAETLRTDSDPIYAGLSYYRQPWAAGANILGLPVDIVADTAPKVPYAPDGLSENTAGHSFVVRQDDLTKTVKLAVYAASANCLREWTMTASEATTPPVNVTGTNTIQPNIRYHVRVREFRGPPMSGQVANIHVGEGQIDPDHAISIDERCGHFWATAVTEAWTANGMVPAAIATGADGIGEVLAETEMTTKNCLGSPGPITVVSNEVTRSNPFYDQLSGIVGWIDALPTQDDMVKVAEIEWTPGSTPEAPSTATIELIA